MTNDSVEKLRGKITCKEDMPYFYIERKFQHPGKGAYVAPPWWLAREWARIEQGVYPEPTAAIRLLNDSLPQLALHVSAEDKTQVCYTPDKGYGEADRQVRTSLAKVVTKYWPHLSDDSIRDMQAGHFSDLDDSFEEIKGMDIVAAYIGMGLGIGACMSKPASRYPEDVHPTEVYDAPNISLAVLRNSNGDISARTMLYCPTPEDKRFIRFWGDPKLKTKLTRRGFKAGTWVGAKFKTIGLNKPDGAGVVQYAFPYLDGNLGYGSDSHSTIACINGVLNCVSPELAEKLRRIFKPKSNITALAKGDAGYAYLTPLDTSSLNITCFLTGKVVSPLIDPVHDYWQNGSIQKICDEALVGLAAVDSLTGYRNLYTSPDTQTFVYGTKVLIETVENRMGSGYVHLDPLLYPDERGWLHELGLKFTCRDTYVKSEEAVSVFDGRWRYEHQSIIDKRYIKLHARGDELSYAAPGVEVLKTGSGRKVVSSGYALSKCYDGTWEFTRSVVTTRLLGILVYYQKKSPAPSVFDELFVDFCRDLGRRELLLTTAARDAASYPTTIFGRDCRSWEPRDLRMQHFDTPKIRGSSEVVDRLVKIFNLLEAEANALDYNLPGTPQLDYTQVIEVKSPAHYKDVRQGNAFEALSTTTGYRYFAGTLASAVTTATPSVFDTGSSVTTTQIASMA